MMDNVSRSLYILCKSYGERHRRLHFQEIHNNLHNPPIRLEQLTQNGQQYLGLEYVIVERIPKHHLENHLFIAIFQLHFLAHIPDLNISL